MKYQANSTALSQSTDCLIIGIYENNELTKSFNEIDQITQGYLSQLAQSQDLSGKIGQATLLHSLPNLATKRVLVAGCGKKGETTERQFKQIIQRVTQTLKELNIQQAVNIPPTRDCQTVSTKVRISSSTFTPSQRLHVRVLAQEEGIPQGWRIRRSLLRARRSRLCLLV